MALRYACVQVEQREVLLKNKPHSMLQASAKGTVPVLVLPDGRVIDESADIMRWALSQYDPDNWWRKDLEHATHALLQQNDQIFKKHLDRYKYADRYPGQAQSSYRAAAEKFLLQLEQMLVLRHHLVDDQLTFADIAVFPFVRQFAFVDKHWFDHAPYPRLQSWLQLFLDSELFFSVMAKLATWHEGKVDE